MGKIIKNGIEYSGTGSSGASSADKLSYDNTSSGLEATNVQGAIDEVKVEIDNKVDTTDSRLTDARTPKEHDHDDKYYTETEIDNKFDTTNQNVTNNANAITQLNSDMQWNNYGSVSGSNQISLNSIHNEFHVCVTVPTSNQYNIQKYIFDFKRIDLDESKNNYMFNGYYLSESNYFMVQLEVKGGSVKIVSVTNNGNDITDTITVECFGRVG